MITIAGNYPRSEELIQATRDFDRNRIDQYKLEQAYEKDFFDFLKLQEKLNFPFISTGLFNYQDLIRPFSIFIKNSIANTLLRFEETNVFWRKLEVSKIEIDDQNFDKYLAEYLKLDRMKNYNYLISLPSPLTLSKYSNLNIENSTELITEVFIRITDKWNSNNVIAFAFIEYTEIENLDKLITFSQKIKNISVDNKNTQLFLFFKNKIKNFKDIEKLNFDGISINFYTNPIRKIESDQNFQIERLNSFKYLFAGIINTNTTRLEDTTKIQQFIDYIKTKYKNTLYITDDFYAELLPREIMDNKIINISKIFAQI